MENEKTSDAAGAKPPMSRTILSDVSLHPAKPTARVQARKITMAPGHPSGPHVHNCPVVGSIVEGSVVYQIEGESASVLGPGDTFYEPEDVVVARFDATEEGVTFLAYFLLAEGQEPEITVP